MDLDLTHLSTPLGTYVLVASATGAVLVKPEEQAVARLARLERQGARFREAANPVNDAVADELTAYFAGHRRDFTVPLDLWGSEFQRTVWSALCNVSYGTLTTYGALAGALGRPAAARAIGRAVGTNPISIIVPCHRVIGSDGSLTGYGGGLPRKRALLTLERGLGA